MNVLYANDQSGVYPNSYYHATANELTSYAALKGEVSCDVCVVGAGYTGLSAALHLAQAGYDVVVLDAHRIGWGASGRNGGQLSSALRVGQPELEIRYGGDKARQLWKLGREANQLVRDLIGEHNIDCDLKNGVVHANHKTAYTPHSLAEVEHLSRTYGYEKIEFIDRGDISAMLGTDAYVSGTLDNGAGHLHPLRFAYGLAQAALNAGVRYFEKSEVIDISKTDPAIVSTKNARLRTNYVLIACNGYLGSLEKQTAARVMPINNFIIATEPLSSGMARQLNRDDIAVADSKFVINYFRMSADNRLLFGGGENYSYRFPADIKSFVQKPMLKIYPQLKQTLIEYGWGGTLGITRSRMPVFSRIAPNVFTAGGYSGEGLGMGTFAGKAMALAIDGTAAKFDLMASLPVKKFPGGMIARAPLLALAMLYYSLRDKF